MTLEFAEAIEAAFAAGIHFNFDGKDLIVSAMVQPSDELFETLVAYKPAIFAHMRTHCAWCYKTKTVDHAVIPLTSDMESRIWVHPQCWKPWDAWRQGLGDLGAIKRAKEEESK